MQGPGQSKPPTAASVIRGAEPIALGNGSRAVLLLHGFGDTPQSVSALAGHLHRAGWTVRAPLLSGHGTTFEEHAGTRAADWLADVRRARDELSRASSCLSIVGQSMGGALATILASEQPVDSLVLLAPFFRLSARAATLAALHRAVGLVKPRVVTRSNASIRDPAARARALGPGVTSPRLLRELSRVVRQARACAPRVRSPTLVVHSRADPRIPLRQAEAGFARIGAAEKALRWALRSGHVLAVDFDRDWVAAETRAWLDAHASCP